jgi:hypothetical protein
VCSATRFSRRWVRRGRPPPGELENWWARLGSNQRPADYEARPWPSQGVSGSVRSTQQVPATSRFCVTECPGVSRRCCQNCCQNQCTEICQCARGCQRKNLTRIYLVCHSVSGRVLACQSVSGSVTHHIATSFRWVANVQTCRYRAMHGAGFARSPGSCGRRRRKPGVGSAGCGLARNA